MSLMEKMMAWRMGRMGPKERLEMMEQMMPLMMEGMAPEEVMVLMNLMMPKMMGSLEPMAMMDTMHEMIPLMMANCLDRMNQEERQRMMGFCNSMLAEMEAKFLDQEAPE